MMKERDLIMLRATALRHQVSAYEWGNISSPYLRRLHDGLCNRPDTRCALSWFNVIVLLASLPCHAEKQEQVRQLLERLNFPSCKSDHSKVTVRDFH
jgi:hypothetical protein